MSRIKVYLTEPVTPEAQQLLAAHTVLDVGDAGISRNELLDRVADADVIFSKTDPIKIDAAVIAAAKKLRMIARHGTGYSNVDMDAATARRIPVTITPGANAVTIAEYTVGLMIASCRRLPDAVAQSRRGNPERLQFMGMELCGKTFGIIGVGRIGREVVRRVHALGMHVLAYHPRPSAAKLADLPLTLVALETLLRESDVVSIHAPATADTRNLIGGAELSLMKPTSHLLNLSRGGIVDEVAVRRVLLERKLAGYATDVLANEPVAADDPLLDTPNAIVLPHIAAVTREAQGKVAMTAVEEILRFAKGEPLVHVVNTEVLSGS